MPVLSHANTEADLSRIVLVLTPLSGTLRNISASPDRLSMQVTAAAPSCKAALGVIWNREWQLLGPWV
jgi:hypothetical protein